MRVAYDEGQGVWRSLNRDLPSITADYEDADYYYWDKQRNWLIRFFGGWVGAEEPTGEILAPDGRRIGELPPCLPPSFRGKLADYKGRFGWVQGQDDAALKIAFSCPDPGDFRAVLDLHDLSYSQFRLGVR